MRDVVIVGAGPAGLAAAEQACAAGASVTLLDSSDGLGGQFWRHLPGERPAEREHVAHHRWRRFTALRSTLEGDSRCRILTSAQVWAIEQVNDGCGLLLQVLVGPADGTDRAAVTMTPDALILATGAHDRVLPFPGWDLPGVFSAGAAQALAKSERVAVGSRVLVTGAGPFLLPVAASLAQVGATVVGVHEASSARTLAGGWLRRPWQLAGSTGKLGELAGYAAGHARHRIGYHPGSAVVEAHGTDHVETVTVARLDRDWRPVPGTAHRVEVNAVCVSHGFTPRLELPVAAGCTIDTRRFVAVDHDQLTSVPDVFAAGEITGIGGMPLAAAEGAVAGCRAAGATVPPGLRKARDRQRRFAARLEAAHGIRPGWTGWLTDDTLVCRCEEVDVARLTAHREGSRSLRSLKLTTRAGLGICQGRMCGATVEEILGAPRSLLGATSTDRRPLAAPLRLRELAADPADERTQ